MHYQKLTMPLEIKQLSGREFDGYGSTFGNVDFGGDVVLPGAFKASLAQYKQDGTLPPMFWMHQMDQVPGKWLDMREDDKGLYVKGVLADTPLGNEVHSLLKMDAVRGMSIGYITRDSDYTNDGVRMLKQVDLIENSIVSLPMNPKAQIQHVKARLSARGEYVPTEIEIAEIKRDCENFLRTKGWGRRAAIAGVANLFKEFPDVISDNSRSADVISDDCPVKSIASPDEMEVDAGISSFKDQLLLQDLNKSLARIFG